MVELFRQLLAELPPGLELVASEVRARAQMTLAGTASATLPAPPVEDARPPPPIPRQMVFLLKDAKWRNPERSREFEFAERFSFASVPLELAHKALERGVAVLPESEQAQKFKYNKRGAPPLPEKCIDLDTGELPKPPAGIVPWNLEVLDRGLPTKMFLPTSPSFAPLAVHHSKTTVLTMKNDNSRANLASLSPASLRDARAVSGVDLSCGAGRDAPSPISCHEAGHAIVARCLGLPIEGVTIVSSLDFDGLCFGPDTDPSHVTATALREEAERRCNDVITLLSLPGERRDCTAAWLVHAQSSRHGIHGRFCCRGIGRLRARIRGRFNGFRSRQTICAIYRNV
jgi:hypothetical protein